MAKYIHTKKGRKIRSDAAHLHKHPSHPYLHPEGRTHQYPPTSRIPDRKGKQFRHTPQERRRTHVKGKIGQARGKGKRWD